MLSLEELKNWLHRDLPNHDKLLLVMVSLDGATQVQQIKKRAIEGGLRAVEKWNVSSILSRTKGLAINGASGWELSDAGKQHIRALGIGKVRPAAVSVAVDLRKLLGKIKDDDTRAYLEEAVQCYELDLFRSAVVMSWLAAVHVLKVEVVAKHLAAFNVEARRIDPRWRPARTTDDLGSMKESDFLDRLAAISMIGKNVKEELKKRLDFRNACGHPNSMKLGPNAVTHHIENLLLNVLQRFT